MQRFIRLALGIGLVLGTLLLAANALGGRGGSSGGALTPGDAARGQIVFEQEGCSACHATTTRIGIGTGMAGVMQPKGPLYPPGIDYRGALPNGAPRTAANIAAFIRSTNQGQIGLMPGRTVDDQDMADLLAYLATLRR